MRKPIFLIILFSFFWFSCDDSSQVKKSEILSDNEFVDILIDLHKADGIIVSSDIRKRNRNRLEDSISLYNYVLKKHNVSRKTFSKTVKYYSFHIEEYNLFYDSVNDYFTQLQKTLKIEAEKENEKLKEERDKLKDSSNLWVLKGSWELPKDGETNPIAFKIPVKEHGTYTLRASIRLFRDDKSVNQRMTLIANYEDGSKDLNSAGSMIKDGRYENYEVSINTNKLRDLKSISGWILDHSKGTKEKHASVREIKLSYVNEEKTN